MCVMSTLRLEERYTHAHCTHVYYVWQEHPKHQVARGKVVPVQVVPHTTTPLPTALSEHMECMVGIANRRKSRCKVMQARRAAIPHAIVI